MTAPTGRVLVLGSDTRSFLAVVRSLGRAGLEVHVAWCPAYSAALRSKYVKAIHPIPYYRPQDSEWIDRFNELLSEHEFDLVIPCDDSSLVPLQLHKQQLVRQQSIYLLAEESYRVTSDKHATYALARALDISLPRQAVATNQAELETAIREFGIPAVVKPPRSAEADDPQARRFVKKIRRPEEIELLATPMLARGPVLIQEHFLGIGVGVETLCRNGDILVAFQHERVHEPLLGGGSSYRKSVPLNPEMLEAARRLMKALDYTGVCMIEFRFNPKSRRWVLIEINGRFWGSLPLAIASGIDFPRYLYEMWVYGKTDFNVRYRSGLYCRNWLIDLAWLRSNIRLDRTDPTLLTVPLHRVATEVLNPLLLRERSDTFTIDDPGPALDEFLGLFSRAFVRVASSLPLFRKRLHASARAALQPASSVLFVCKGNICRSPFAERYAHALKPQLIVWSAGFLPLSGRSSPAMAVEIAGLHGIDLSHHRSRMLAVEDLGRFDVIFVFDADQVRAIRHIARIQRKRVPVMLLGALDLRGPLEIRDPFGQDAAAFETAYDRIAQALQNGLGAMESPRCAEISATVSRSALAEETRLRSQANSRSSSPHSL